VLAVRYDWRNNSVLFVHHFADTPREASFSVGLADGSGKRPINLLSEDHSHARDDGKHRFILEPYGYRWYRVGGLDYLPKRSDLTQRDDGRSAPRDGRRRLEASKKSTKG
jgi:maltose alpha-D-glucosyltransferase/alpha-amylase